MRFPPPDVVVSWPAPNLINPEVRKPYLIPVNIILISTATLIVLIRIYARFIYTRTTAIDDWLAVIALFPAIGLTVTTSLAASRYGWSQHIWDYQYSGVDPSKLIDERAISWASQMLYVWSSSLTKLSLLYFYRQIFAARFLRGLVQWCIYFVMVYFAVCVFTLLFECRPLSLYWHILVLPQGAGGVCADEGSILLAAGLLNVFIDVVILILPIPTFLKLHMRWPQMLQVLAVFMAGILVCISSTIRIAATWIIARETYDVTWAGYQVCMWVGIEVDVGLMCASIPGCHGLLKSWDPKLKTSRNQSNQTGGLDGVIQKTVVTSIEGSYVRVVSSNGEDGNTRGSWVLGSQSSLKSKVWAGRDEDYHLDYLGEGDAHAHPHASSPEATLPPALVMASR